MHVHHPTLAPAKTIHQITKLQIYTQSVINESNWLKAKLACREMWLEFVTNSDVKYIDL